MSRTPRRYDATPCTTSCISSAPPPAAVLPRPSPVRISRPAPLAAILLAASLLVVAPASLPAQERPGGALERLDRIRVLAEGLDEGGEEFQLLRVRSDSLVLVGADGGGVELLAVSDIRELEVRRETGGSHLLEGVIVGTGVGVLGYLAAVGSDDGPVENPEAHAAVTVLPGAVLGAVVGSAVPDREWVAVEIGPAASTRGASPNGPPAPTAGADAPSAPVIPGRTSPGTGLSLRLKLRPLWLP